VKKSFETVVFQGDIGKDFSQALLRFDAIAWDIETTGLDWRNDKIGTCQLHHPALGTAIVQLHDIIPSMLLSLLSCKSLLKIFHHAPFDLRFMTHRWKAQSVNVACTKIAAKILMPGMEKGEYSLLPLLKRRLGVTIDKSQQRSNWLSASLSSEQITYAASDVMHLIPLFEDLRKDAITSGVWHLTEATFAYLPTRVALDLRGVNDVFVY
jgi:ribonuclease D